MSRKILVLTGNSLHEQLLGKVTATMLNSVKTNPNKDHNDLCN